MPFNPKSQKKRQVRNPKKTLLNMQIRTNLHPNNVKNVSEDRMDIANKNHTWHVL